jgi:hypothetical protein
VDRVGGQHRHGCAGPVSESLRLILTAF